LVSYAAGLSGKADLPVSAVTERDGIG
jgi:hypothetical protein